MGEAKKPSCHGLFQAKRVQACWYVASACPAAVLSPGSIFWVSLWGVSLPCSLPCGPCRAETLDGGGECMLVSGQGKPTNPCTCDGSRGLVTQAGSIKPKACEPDAFIIAMGREVSLSSRVPKLWVSTWRDQGPPNTGAFEVNRERWEGGRHLALRTVFGSLGPATQEAIPLHVLGRKANLGCFLSLATKSPNSNFLILHVNPEKCLQNSSSDLFMFCHTTFHKVPSSRLFIPQLLNSFMYTPPSRNCLVYYVGKRHLEAHFNNEHQESLPIQVIFLFAA